MQRVTTLLDKIKELVQRPDVHPIDVDLMMDYTKVLYADLIEWRNKLSFRDNLAVPSEPLPQPQAAAAPRTVAQQPSMEENIQASEAQPEIAAPPVELDITSANYAEPEEKEIPQPRITAYPDIRRSIGINDKYQFISELFSNDKNAYEQVMDKINTCHTEEEAVAWVQREVATEFQWGEDDEAVQYFYTTLNDYFINR